MWEDLLFLAAGGFLIGALAYTGWYTTKYEPEAKPGYALIGIGVLIDVGENLWLEFQVNASSWFLIVQLAGYMLIATGLAMIVHTRRRGR